MNLKGYVSVRIPVPVSVQNLLLRDYCARNGHSFLHADVEFIMPDSYVMLKGMLAYADAYNGILAYSMFLMPSEPERGAFLNNLLAAGKCIIFALENIAIKKPEDIDRVEVLWQIAEHGRHGELPAVVVPSSHA